MGFVDTTEQEDWQECFADLVDEHMPVMVVRLFLQRAGPTQSELAKRNGISQR